MADEDASRTRLMIDAARLHYEHGLTHQEVADEFGLSRIKVTRLLAQARATGVVEIRINAPEEPLADLADRLCERYRLSTVWIAPTLPDAARATTALDQVGAAAIGRMLEGGSLVGVSLSSTLGRAIEQVTPREHAGASPIGFVPMAGSWGGWQQGINPAELAQRLARRVGGRAFSFPAPLLAPSPEFAATLTALPEVSDALKLARAADTLLFGLGGLDWTTSQLQDSLSDQEKRQLVERGAVGDIGARFFDTRGRQVTSDVDRRVIGLSLDDMSHASQRLVLAAGKSKLKALRIALSVGIATALCTDSATARGQLD